MITSLKTELRIKQLRLKNIRFRNIVKLHFGNLPSRHICKNLRLKSNEFVFILLDPSGDVTDDDIVLANAFAHIISMCVHLQYVFIQRFRWFSDIIRYVNDNCQIAMKVFLFFRMFTGIGSLATRCIDNRSSYGIWYFKLQYWRKCIDSSW